MQFSENTIITDHNSSLSLNESPTSAIIQGVFKRNPKNLFQWMDNDTHKVYEQFEVQIDNKIHLRGHGETFYIVSEQGIWNRVIPPRSRKLHNLSDGESESEDPNIVWRSLRKDEEPKKTGVRPPEGHDPSITASAHITAGSRARAKSPWVSTSRSRKVAAAWASESDKRVAKLQIPQDQDPSMHFDLTNPHHATTVFPTGKGSSLNTAKASQEVVLKGGLGPEQVLALYEARKIKVYEYNDIKKRLEDGEEIFIDGKKIYAAFRTRTTTTSRPEPRLLLELPDN